MDKDEGKEEPKELQKQEEMRLRKKTSKNSSDKCSQGVGQWQNLSVGGAERCTSSVQSEILALPKLCQIKKNRLPQHKGNKQKKLSGKHSRFKEKWNVNDTEKERKNLDMEERETAGPFLMHFL